MLWGRDYGGVALERAHGATPQEWWASWATAGGHRTGDGVRGGNMELLASCTSASGLYVAQAVSRAQ
jgi:hypothetical protein